MRRINLSPIRYALLFACVLIALGTSDRTVMADQWVVWRYSPDEWGIGNNPILEGMPSAFVCTLSGSSLTFNATYSRTVGSSSSTHWTLRFAGTWATCGSVETVEGQSVLVPDPYAEFVQAGAGGFVRWRGSPPVGYVATVLLGYSFAGNGEVPYIDTYLGNPWNPGAPPTMATLALERATGSGFDFFHSKSAAMHATYVPEPSAILALLCGLGGLGLRMRKRQ